MTGAKQSRRCNLLTFFSTILATVLLLIFQRFSPTAAAVPQWRRGGTQEHIDVARGAEAVGHGQGRCEDSLRGGSSRWRRRRGFADGGRGTRVRLALQHAAVGNWYRLGTLRVLPHLLGNSDPDKLREKAAELVKLSAEELLKRQMEIKELMEKFKAPSDAELIKIAIADLNNSSLEDRQRALQELLILVEPIDNANGLLPLIQELGNADEGIRTTSAWVLGKASQDNVLVQNQINGYGALDRLVKMGYSSSGPEAAKALYTISSLIRDNEHGQELFLSENGYAMLQHILSTTNTSVRLQKKVVSLLAYIADFQLNTGKSQAQSLLNHFFI
ncbi:hsp70 nucleotide exchange factor FES1 isoform X2 [Zea mays]|uniref:hsp70 nucleotide exchange factor FES1 isoform X2 n=2 Tax=Zea mays TaxID=4577 RepID=UPI0009AA5017|nr:hsp70 nucleotide exchange factor FES1 isoform X2 [Zea mays]|eukprot:XP_020404064.1 hsp70 nucleotide exchange factor FES1 isoform X2 [Zea mays]